MLEVIIRDLESCIIQIISYRSFLLQAHVFVSLYSILTNCFEI